MKPDIFISYRREGARAEAILLYCKLQAAGYNVFLDLTCMHSGVFTEEIKRTISGCTDVILLVSPNCFKRCEDPNDCFRQEIEWALKEEKQITQILVNQKNYPPKLPESIKKLSKMNAMEFPPMRHVDDLIRVLQDPQNLKAQPNTGAVTPTAEPLQEEVYEEDDGPDEVCRSCKSEDISEDDPLGFWLAAADGYLHAIILEALMFAGVFLLGAVYFCLSEWITPFREWSSTVIQSLFPAFCAGFEDVQSMFSILMFSILFAWFLSFMVAERFYQYMQSIQLREAEKGYRWLSYKCHKCGSKYKKRVRLYHVSETEVIPEFLAAGGVLLVLLLSAAFLWNVMMNLFLPEYYGWIPFLSLFLPVFILKNHIHNKINVHLEQIPPYDYLIGFFKSSMLLAFDDNLENDEDEEEECLNSVDTENEETQEQNT